MKNTIYRSSKEIILKGKSLHDILEDHQVYLSQKFPFVRRMYSGREFSPNLKAVIIDGDLSNLDLKAETIADIYIKNCDVSESNLSGIDGIYSWLINSNLDNSILSNSRLQSAHLQGSSFKQADLRNADLQNSNLSETDFSGANLSGADLRRCNIHLTNFENANLNGANLHKIDFRQAKFNRNTDLTNANLSYANLEGINLEINKFENACLRNAQLESASIVNANLTNADLERANLRNASLINTVLKKANLKNACLISSRLFKANLNEADLRNADFSGALIEYSKLNRTNFQKAALNNANIIFSDIKGASFERSLLKNININHSNLSQSVFVETDFTNSNMLNCRVFGISAWKSKSTPTKSEFIISLPGEPTITVNNLEVAQFVYLLINNRNIRYIFDTITAKVVLILGRFLPENILILRKLQTRLIEMDYVPVIFDFDNPKSRTTDETISILARLAKFIIADLSNAKSVLQELRNIVPNLPSVPIAPIINRQSNLPSMFDYFQRFPWVMPVHLYKNENELMDYLYEIVKVVKNKLNY